MSSTEDESLCPLCHETTYVGETISCETCNLWFHFSCVGVTHNDDVVQRQDLPFYCPKCSKEKKTIKKVTSSSPKDGKRRKRDKEEEEWLDAVESGTLSEVVDPELKNIKNPRLMTARQRAMAERQSKGESIDVVGSKSEDEDNEEEEEPEAIKQLKAIKSAKRKEIEMEKREIDKKKTMDRLLKKRESKATKLMKSSRMGINRGPVLMTYRMNKDGSRTLSLAPGVDYPLAPSSISNLPEIKVKLCQICQIHPKIYNCSKTHVPLCSINCYKKNLAQRSAIEGA